MYGISTKDKISQELLSSYEAWNKYLAHIWYNFIYYAEIKETGTIIEIAPGTSPKIAMALQKMSFKGSVYLVEPYKKALQTITSIYQQCLPHANIIPVEATLFDSLHQLPKNPKLLVSHHPIDDMIIASQIANNWDSYFDWVHDDKLLVKTNFKEVWLELQQSPDKLNHVIHQISKEWIQAIEVLKPDFTMLSQYPSLVFENDSLSLKELNLISQMTFKQIKQYFKENLENEVNIQAILNANKNYNFHLIGEEVLNAMNWMFYQYE